ncbi:hypothetical protein [Parasphingorhabdus sp.]|uniref:hypothetical protein n=1 Tax=Parasphingorhabdus sp. TaxID=2709688 RepID=UPI003001EE74
MNAYIASFMLLLFNAVGLAVPASAAAEERMMPDLGSAAHAADAAVAEVAGMIESSGVPAASHPFAAIAALLAPRTLVSGSDAGRQPQWSRVAMRAEAGDKLEHVEGAP